MAGNDDLSRLALEQIERARRRAKTRARISDPVEILSDAELELPIDGADASGQAPNALPPITVGGYTIIQEISSGGQATVFRAVQKSTGRVVALKILPGGPLAGARARARFDREAAILAQLDHPNIVRIIDRCFTADGALVLVMDYIEGRRLDAAWADQPHSGMARNVAALFVSVAEGVDEAHRLGIVHRDLKPSNILLDHRGHPRVLDFGLAYLNSSSSSASVTSSGQMVGSLPWASPEQVSLGSDATLGAPSDVYSLGVMLYQALTGNAPYATTGSLREVIAAIQRTQPPDAHLTKGGRERGVDAALSAIARKALAKRVTDRYGTAGALAEDLRRWIDGARPVAEYASRVRARIRWARLAVIALVLTVIAFVVLVFVPLNDAPKPVPAPAPIPVARFTNALGMTFVQIPGGQFITGSPADAPNRREDEVQTQWGTSEPIWIATHEVTRGQYRKVMGALPPLAAEGLSDDAPVDAVSWEDARSFCERLSTAGRGYRLPTAEQWELSCRDTTRYRDFSGTGILDEMGWHAGNSGKRLHPVGQKLSNAYGIHDMHGNVAEWCLEPYWARRVIESDENIREIRGGSAMDPPERCRTVARSSGEMDEALSGVGFRVVMSITPVTTSTSTATGE